ncbi:MAG: ABC-2 family transporter protein [Candidatus Obscuribacterales bacterium]|nr:ABC-2 family transporter protein [Candidatus Obscuribacterales bacterium]
MNAIKKYFFVAWIAMRSNLAYFSEVSGRLIFLGVVLFIFLRLWQVTFGENGAKTLGGLTLAQMLWYLTVTEAIILSSPPVARLVDQDVRTGALSVQLTRPLYYPFFCLFTNLGERFLRFFLNLAVGSVIAYIFVGPINFRADGLALFLLSVPLAFTLDFSVNFLIGLGAFWLEDTAGLTLIYSRILMIFGGMLIPIELFPEWLQPAVKWLPFSSVVYGPAHLFVKPDLAEFALLLLRQTSALLVIGIAVYWVFQTAMRRVFVNGG